MNIKKTLSIMCALLGLVACGGDVKSTLGMRKSTPDEFMVISNPPLKNPPEFKLNAPTTKSSSPVHDITERGVMGKEDRASLDKDEQEFLQQLDGPSTSSAKALVDDDYKHNQSKKESKNALSKGIDKVRGDADEPVVDPISERARIKANTAENKPINEGEIKNKSQSTLGRLFN